MFEVDNNYPTIVNFTISLKEKRTVTAAHKHFSKRTVGAKADENQIQSCHQTLLVKTLKFIGIYEEFLINYRFINSDS